MIRPDWSGPSDATTIGTGAHAAVEWVLSGGAVDEVMPQIAMAVDTEMAMPNFAWKKYNGLGRNGLIGVAYDCFKVWLENIYPIMPRNGTPEVPFEVPLYTLPDGRTVGIRGTIDWVPHDTNQLWDWKNPGRAYSQKDKQKFAIQPSIYALAAVQGGLRSVTDFQFTLPLTFVYGTSVIYAAGAQARVFDVVRTRAHVEWALDRLKTAVDLALGFGLDKPWPQNDNHWLCSDRWCPWWSACKGARLSWQDEDYEGADWQISNKPNPYKETHNAVD